MRAHKTKIILNPNADMGRAWRMAADLRPIVEEFGGADWSGTVYPTHATELAREAAEDGYELVIAAGGDGTVHEVVNGLMQVEPEKRSRLGALPLGSGNDFVYSMGLSANLPDALRQILSGTPRRVDIGVVEDDRGRREFIDNTIGIGFNAVVTIRSHSLPVVRGFMMYLIAVMQTIFMNHDPTRMRIVTDQEELDDELLMFVMCNGPREGGGFLVAPQAVPDDGVFHYTTVHKVSRLMMFRLLPEFLKGTQGRFKPVRMGQLRELTLEANRPLYIHIDGEIFAGFGTDVRKLKLAVIPGALEVMV